MIRTLTPFLSLIIAVLLYLFFTDAQYQEIKNIQASIKEYNIAYERYNDFSGILNEKYSAVTSRSVFESERLDTMVPKTIDDSKIIVDLEAMAKRHRLLFGNIATEQTELSLEKDGADTPVGGEDELQTTNVSFGVIGTYGQFKNFLKELESSLTIYEVVDITFDVEEGIFQQFDVTVRTYALPDNTNE
jgi:hypothetical protein